MWFCSLIFSWRDLFTCLLPLYVVSHYSVMRSAEVEFLDEIRPKSPKSFLPWNFTVPSTALLWDFCFFKRTQPLTVTSVQLPYTRDRWFWQNFIISMCGRTFWKDNENLRSVYKKVSFFHFWLFKVSNRFIVPSKRWKLFSSNGAIGFLGKTF
jgi:hypothetical protein